MTDIVRVVKESSSSGKNQAQLTITPMWSSEVHLIDWSQFFHSVFKPIPGITTYYHFKVSKAEPGIVVVKEYANSPEAKLEIEKKDVNAISLRGQQPNKIIPTGLDAKWQWYLIRPFCSTNLAKDMTCPKPSVARPVTAPQAKKKQKKT